MNLADVFVRVRADLADFNKAMGQLNANVSRSATSLGTSFAKAGAGMTRVGNALTTNLTLPILAVGGASAKMALDFNTSMQRIVGLAKVPREEIAGISDEILKMGAEIGRDPQELADAFYFVASAGFSAKEAMEVLRISAIAAASGMGQTQDIAQVLGGVINAYGHENLSAAHAGDVLTAAIQDGAAEASNFAGVLGFVTPVAASLGVGFDQVTAAIAAMTQVGISADTAATNLGQVMASLQKPTKDAEDTLNSLGLSAAGLRQELKEKGLLETLRTLQDRFAGNDEAAAKVFGNIRALRGVTALLGLDTEQLNGIFADTAGAAGNLAQAYKDTEGPQRDIDKAMAELKATGIEIGNDVLPIVVDVLKDVAGAAKSVAGWWKGLSDETKKSIVQWAGIIAIGGPVLSILGKLTSGLGGILKAVGWLTKADGLPRLVKSLRDARLGMLGFTTVAVVGAAEIGQGWKDTFDNVTRGILDEFAGKVGVTKDQVTKDLNTIADGLGITVPEAAKRLAESMHAHGDDYKAAVAAMVASTESLSPAIDSAVVAARDVEGRVKTAAGDTVKGVATTFEDGSTAVGNAAGDMMAPLSEEAQKAKDAAIQAMKDALTGMVSALADNPNALRDEMKALTDRLKDPYTDAEREADIAGALTSKTFRDALKSQDTGLISDTATKINDLLNEYNLLEPGALQSGKSINPALQEGIGSNIDATLDWLQTNVITPTTDKFQLADELKQIGLDGLAAYVLGIAQNEQDAETEANRLKNRAVAGVDDPDSFYNAGKGAATSFGSGLVDPYAVGYVNQKAWNLRNTASRILEFSGSPPFTHSHEIGVKVAESWADGLAEGFKKFSMPSLVPAAFGIGLKPMGATAVSAVAPVGGVGNTVNNTWVLNVDGVQRTFNSRTDFMNALDDLAAFGGSDGRMS